MGRYISYGVTGTLPGGKYYKDRQYINGFPPVPGTPTFTTPTYTDTVLRSAFFTTAYSASPAMALNVPNLGAKYPTAFKDADGNYLSDDHSYRMHLPAGIPAKLFWSVTLYNADNASGLDNGQPFPSINRMDKPATNSDGSIDIYFGPKSPGEGKNWIATVPGKGFLSFCVSTVLRSRFSISPGSRMTSLRRSELPEKLDLISPLERSFVPRKLTTCKISVNVQNAQRNPNVVLLA
jgi:hypothetical protein